MFQKIYRALRSRTISLSAKIVVLIVASVISSLSLTGWLLYGSLRDRTIAEISEGLLQVASTSSINFDLAQLKRVKSADDLRRGACKTCMATLGKIWKENRFDRQEKWVRLSVLRLDIATGDLSYVLDLLDSSKIGKRAPPTPRLLEDAKKGEAVAEDFDEDNDGWLTAYAPIGGSAPGDRELYFVCVQTRANRVQARLMASLANIILASLAGLLIAIAGGWFLTHQITKPMRAFVDVMRLMQSTGDFDLRIDVHPGDKDMSVVEETFSSLIAKVRESRRKEESSYWSTLQALVSALDVRDNETAGHSVRVTRYSLAIAERMHVSVATMDQLRQGSLLHDIGKIGVPDAVLRKTSKLTEAEWKEMQKHPVIGKTFLEDIEFLRPATAVVYCHHERWDGSGYPGGLAGDSIPLAARIFAVADALDTITSERYYKKAKSFRDAREEIERSSGSHFDPAVVKSFLTLPEKAFLRIRLDTNMAVMQLEKKR
jgi:HD-GYP domain-containing protein (c-di-GMP phosphodiesterase class II)